MPCGYKRQAPLPQDARQLCSNACMCLLQAHLHIPLSVDGVLWELCVRPVYPVEGCNVVQQQQLDAASLLQHSFYGSRAQECSQHKIQAKPCNCCYITVGALCWNLSVHWKAAVLSSSTSLMLPVSCSTARVFQGSRTLTHKEQACRGFLLGVGLNRGDHLACCQQIISCPQGGQKVEAAATLDLHVHESSSSKTTRNQLRKVIIEHSN